MATYRSRHSEFVILPAVWRLPGAGTLNRANPVANLAFLATFFKNFQGKGLCMGHSPQKESTFWKTIYIKEKR